jgi:hypothetical protein
MYIFYNISETMITENALDESADCKQNVKWFSIIQDSLKMAEYPEGSDGSNNAG